MPTRTLVRAWACTLGYCLFATILMYLAARLILAATPAAPPQGKASAASGLVGIASLFSPLILASVFALALRRVRSSRLLYTSVVTAIYGGVLFTLVTQITASLLKQAEFEDAAWLALILLPCLGFIMGIVAARCASFFAPWHEARGAANGLWRDLGTTFGILLVAIVLGGVGLYGSVLLLATDASPLSNGPGALQTAIVFATGVPALLLVALAARSAWASLTAAVRGPQDLAQSAPMRAGRWLSGLGGLAALGGYLLPWVFIAGVFLVGGCASDRGPRLVEHGPVENVPFGSSRFSGVIAPTGADLTAGSTDAGVNALGWAIFGIAIVAAVFGWWRGARQTAPLRGALMVLAGIVGIGLCFYVLSLLMANSFPVHWGLDLRFQSIQPGFWMTVIGFGVVALGGVLFALGRLPRLTAQTGAE